ncbi:MAG: LexA repressor [Chlamydiales bacterium]|nr:LexA repressor [Chlamydiales bacterium]MCH9620435.1 LexA repressor [Chlamydiales bacterium]MCH9622919.1 LexA repressor [Chlamydiales bacterium]
MIGLTKRQREITEFIENYQTVHQLSPTYREIMLHFQFSSLGTVYSQIKTLKRKGILKGEGARALTLVQEENKESHVPLIGKLAATLPIQTYSQIIQLSIPLYLASNKESYLIRVEDDMLAEELIMEGDLLLIEPRSTFEEGELVLALIDEMTTLVKKAYRDTPYIRFESSNREIQPLILQEDHVTIQGVICSLLRDYRGE